MGGGAGSGATGPKGEGVKGSEVPLKPAGTLAFSQLAFRSGARSRRARKTV